MGERRRYDERPGMFLLRARNPERYGKWRDGMQATRQHPDGAARVLGHALAALAQDNRADAAGRPRPERAPLKTVWLMDDPAEQCEREKLQEAERYRAGMARQSAYLRTLDEQTGAGLTADGFGDHVARTS